MIDGAQVESGMQSGPEGRGRSILLVDDDRWLCALLKHWLGDEGFRVSIVHEVPDAEELAERERPALVLLDLHLPGRSGIGMLEELRGLWPDVPVLMLSADEAVPSVVGAMKAGATDYMAKPVSRPDLLERIAMLLRAGPAPTGPVPPTRRPLAAPLADIERDAIVEALAHCDGNLSETSRRLGIGRTTLYRKLRKFGLRKP